MFAAVIGFKTNIRTCTCKRRSRTPQITKNKENNKVYCAVYRLICVLEISAVEGVRTEHSVYRFRAGLAGSLPDHLPVLFDGPDEEQETSGDFGSGGGVILLDDQEDEPSQSGRSRQKKRRGRLHPRGTIEDDEDEEDDKDDETGYTW